MMGLMSIGYTQPAPQPSLAELEAEVTYWHRQLSAFALLEEVSAVLNVDRELVWQVLATIPDNMASLFDSPQGWTALAGFAATELGLPAPYFMPAVH